MRIELGAGARARAGFVAVDLDPKNADVVGDALHLPFGDSTVSQIRAVDVLEHISYRHTDAALCEWWRVLKPGGQLYVQVPDAETIMRWFVADSPNLLKMEGRHCTVLEGATWRLLGGHDDGKYANDETWRWNAHNALFTMESLSKALDLAGFAIVNLQRNGHPNLLCDAIRK